jgi:Ca2+/Na+ antiporter
MLHAKFLVNWFQDVQSFYSIYELLILGVAVTPQAQVAPALAGAAASAGVSTTTLVISSVLSAVVATLCAVIIVMVIRQVRHWRTNQAAKKAFSTMGGRLAHSDNMGFDNVSRTTADSEDSVSSVDVNLE